MNIDTIVAIAIVIDIKVLSDNQAKENGRKRGNETETDSPHLLILGFERGTADEKLVHENTDGPMVDFFIVTPIFHHFRRQVVQSAAKRLPPRRRRVNGPTEVGDLDLTWGRGWAKRMDEERGKGGISLAREEAEHDQRERTAKWSILTSETE